MKKTNNSEDNLDDSDELRKKKFKTDVVTDQMVPVPESGPLQIGEEAKDGDIKPDVKSEEINSLLSKPCRDVHDIQDLLDLESMYEDVNSPEDFDDYDEVHEYCSTEEISKNSGSDNKPENCILEDIAENATINHEQDKCSVNDAVEFKTTDHKQENCITDNASENVNLDCEHAHFATDDTAKNVNSDHDKENFVAAGTTENVSIDCDPENCITDSAENTSIDNKPEDIIADGAEENVVVDQEPVRYITADTEEDVILDHVLENLINDVIEENPRIRHKPEDYAEDVTENLNIDHKSENYIAENTPENASVEYESKNYIARDVAESYEAKGTSVSCKTVISKSVEKENTQDIYVVEDCSLPSSDASIVRRDESPIGEPVPTICSTASMEEDPVDGDDEEEEEDEDGVERDVENVCYSLNTEDEVMHDPVESQVDYTVTAGGRDIVPEVDDVTCDSGGDTVLVMKREVYSEGCGVSKQNKMCSMEEITYTEPLNSIESVDKMIFHSRNSVIETANASASLHSSDSRAMKCGDSQFLCELPVRETVGVAKYHDNYAYMAVNSVFPKRVYNTVHISSVPESSESELYGYNSSVQNMMLCRNNTVIDASTVPMTSNVNGLETYSFHRVPVESSSCIRNMNDSYGHSNPGFCPVIQNSRFEFGNSNVTTVKKLPTEEDFMRRIEKTLFESKIENKIDDPIDSKYKSEVDLSLPLKKRLRTLAAISNNITGTPEKLVAPKEDSFPSYPAKPMISIAELEFTEALIPKPGNIYRDNYK